MGNRPEFKDWMKILLKVEAKLRKQIRYRGEKNRPECESNNNQFMMLVAAERSVRPRGRTFYSVLSKKQRVWFLTPFVVLDKYYESFSECSQVSRPTDGDLKLM